MTEKKERRKIEKNPGADATNWDARVRTEQEAPHKWNEAWGQMFANSIPFDYQDRIKFLQNELANCPVQKPRSKYGSGDPFPTFGAQDFRYKKYDPLANLAKDLEEQPTKEAK